MSLPGAANNIADDFLQRNKGLRDQETAGKTEATGLLYLLLKVVSHHSCHTLFTRNESLSLAHTQEERITQGHKYKEVRVFRGHFRACLARILVARVCRIFSLFLIKNCDYGFNSSSFFPVLQMTSFYRYFKNKIMSK